VVVVATNKDGSVNGKQFTVSGVLESATGPGGRDGYVHLQDAMETLRMTDIEISEMAIRIRNFNKLDAVTQKLEEILSKEVTPKGQPIFEVHSWEKLSPFYNIARMIEVMTFFIKLMLIAVVLISIMNVMLITVTERTREIGIKKAIGACRRVLLIEFLVEALILSGGGGLIGILLGVAVPYSVRFFTDAIRIQIHPLAVVLGFSVTLLVGLTFGMVPALRASRLNPVESLRYE